MYRIYENACCFSLYFVNSDLSFILNFEYTDLWHDLHIRFLFRSEKRKRLLNSESDLNEDYPKENDSSR